MSVLSIVVMLLGFGFVIFWHELGHFLGARRAGIRVEQFAVGMGPAVLSYRKGIGVRFGNTQKIFHDRVIREFNEREIRAKEQREAEGKTYQVRVGEPSLREQYEIAHDLGMGETEYRLSLLPIGGYVKPTGQDDLQPVTEAWIDDPKSYAAAPVGKRMVLISAGVIMNVILAGILFFVLFRFVGFEAMRATVGEVQSNSPAARAGLRAGDELLELDGATLHDFTKVLMSVALLPADETVDLKIRRDGEERTVAIRARPTIESNNMLALGISGPRSLEARPANQVDAKLLAKLAPDARLVLPGERIVAVNGRAVGREDYSVYDAEIQRSFGRLVGLTIADANGATREASFVPPFSPSFAGGNFELLGLSPRTCIREIQEKSSAKDQLANGDVILSMARGDEKPILLPSTATFSRTTREAGERGETLAFKVLRDGKPLDVANVAPTTKLPDRARGLGVALGGDFGSAVIGEVDKGSTSATAGVAEGSTVVAVDGAPGKDWYELHRVLVARNDPTAAISLTLRTVDGVERTVTVAPTRDELATIAGTRYADPIETLSELTAIRKTDSTLTALAWGVGETRDLILKGYVTLKRVVYNRSVPASNMSGPVGIFTAGTALFEERGLSWFLWFLALISANLAVVNFLPIPILDGWHFLSLVKEKLTGTPVPERVQEVAQYVGLALILSLIVFVTYNDIMRL